MNYIDPDKVIVEQGELDESLICPICFGVLIDPVQCAKCHHCYCSGCISRLLTKQCSICRDITFIINPADVLKQLEALKFRTLCCDEIITYSQNRYHYSLCKLACCPNVGCTYVGLKDMFERHTSSCPFKLIKCIRCNCDILYRDQRDHEAACLLSAVQPVSVPVVQVNRPSLCEQCVTRIIRYKCYKCNCRVCNKCINSVVNEFIYTGLVKCFFSCKVGIFWNFQNKDGGDLACFIVVYILFGWWLDAFILSFYFATFLFCAAFLLIPNLAYLIIGVPLYLFAWATCLKRRRICKSCYKGNGQYANVNANGNVNNINV
jgi:hypothetical protein